MFSSVYIYAITWLVMALIWIAVARIQRLKCTIECEIPSWGLNSTIARLLEGDPKDISAFEPNIHVRLVVLLMLITSNILVLCISRDRFGIDDVIKRSGQLIIVNLLPVTLLCHRSSFLGWLTSTCKPQFLWVHYSFGWLALAEIWLHFTLWVTPSSSEAGKLNLHLDIFLLIILKSLGILHWSAFAVSKTAGL